MYYKDSLGNLHDDMDGAALLLPSWPADCVSISDEEAEALRTANQSTPTYVDLRRAEYPSLLDLIDGLVKDDADQINTYKQACLAVKLKYPKPT